MVDNFEDETEQSVTIDEYLDTLEEKELEADLVLGGDEGKECTYNTGYMKRQAIFSCLTCMPDGNAGVCTACSLSCHDGHEIVELWTKRNFCCDCGNSKFGTFYCKLLPAKDGENTLNSYNHNFKGLYCTCDRPYPNPEVEEQEEMIQCIICEDWFHEEHLGLESLSEIPKDEEGEPIYEDFICKACVEACSFLGLYSQTICAAIGQVGDAAANSGKDKHVIEEVSSSDGSGKLVNDTQSDGSAKNITVCYCKCNEKALNSGESSENIDLRQCPMDVIEETPLSDGSGKVTTNTCSDGSAKKNEVCHSNCSEKAVNSGEISEKNTDFSQLTKDASPCRGTCLLEVNRVGTSVIESKPFFLRKGWRDNLCRCVNCLDLYKRKGVSYLLDKEDSIAEYEKIAKQKREAKLQGEEGGGALDFLDGLGHVEKIEVLSAIADFKDEFRSFLENFDSSNAITSSDISQIFENLAKKRRTQ